MSKMQFACLKLKSYAALNFRRALKRKADAHMKIISEILNIYFARNEIHKTLCVW